MPQSYLSVLDGVLTFKIKCTAQYIYIQLWDSCILQNTFTKSSHLFPIKNRTNYTSLLSHWLTIFFVMNVSFLNFTAEVPFPPLTWFDDVSLSCPIWLTLNPENILLCSSLLCGFQIHKVSLLIEIKKVLLKFNRKYNTTVYYCRIIHCVFLTSLLPVMSGMYTT